MPASGRQLIDLVRLQDEHGLHCAVGFPAGLLAVVQVRTLDRGTRAQYITMATYGAVIITAYIARHILHVVVRNRLLVHAR